MWQDKNDTCLIVRQRREADKERKSERERKGEGRRSSEREKEKKDEGKRERKKERRKGCGRAIRRPSKCMAPLQVRFPLRRPLAIPTWRTPARRCIKSPSKHRSIARFARWSSSPCAFTAKNERRCRLLARSNWDLSRYQRGKREKERRWVLVSKNHESGGCETYPFRRSSTLVFSVWITSSEIIKDTFHRIIICLRVVSVRWLYLPYVYYTIGAR